jgi:hypothetical protein
MAFPKELAQVQTNLTQFELQEIRDALQVTTQPNIEWIKPIFLLGGMCQADFLFRGQMYTLTEEYELVISIRRK